MNASQCAASQIWCWSFSVDILPKLLHGLLITVLATVVGYALALVLGLVLAMLTRSKVWIVRQVVRWVMEFIRSTPLLVQLYFLFFVFPQIGITLGPFTAGFLGLGIHYSTYISEVYRAGIEDVPKGQWEACRALSLPPHRVWFGVVLPQAIPKVIPSLGNYIISMFKDTPMLSAITIAEMLNVANTIGAQTFRYLEPITVVGILFIVISYPASLITRRLERRFGH